MKLVFTRRARQDLDLIFEYIAADSPVYAQKQVERLIARSSQITRFPLSGRQVPECDRPDVREVVEGNYRIIYHVIAEQLRCDVLTIFHAARLLDQDSLSSSPPAS
jgi:addiction module RelE/StbE family toxin